MQENRTDAAGRGWFTLNPEDRHLIWFPVDRPSAQFSFYYNVHVQPDGRHFAKCNNIPRPSGSNTRDVHGPYATFDEAADKAVAMTQLTYVTQKLEGGVE